MEPIQEEMKKKQEQWECFIQRKRLSLVTRLPHALAEQWMGLKMTEFVTEKGSIYSHTSFKLINDFGTYNVLYMKHDFLFMLLITEVPTKRQLIRFTNLGLPELADEYEAQRDVWEWFALELKQFCHGLMMNEKAGAK